MKLKNLVIIAILSFYSMTAILNGMNDKETNKISENSKLITVQLKDENDRILYNIDIPYSVIRLSNTLINNFSCIDEENLGITIDLDKINNVNLFELKTCLQLLKLWDLNELSTATVAAFPKKSILKLINAADYLDFQELRTILMHALHIKIRKLIYEKNKPLKALNFIHKIEDADLYEKLFDSESNIENKYKQLINSTFIHQRTLSEPVVYAHCLDVSHDNRLLISSSNDKKIHIWDLNTGEKLDIIESGDGAAQMIRFAPQDDKIFFISNNKLKILNLSDSTLMNLHSQWQIDDLSVSNDGTQCAGVSFLDNSRIDLTNLITNDTKTFWGHSDTINVLTFSYDGCLLASSGDDMKTRIWDIASGHCIQIIDQCGTKLVFSPNDKILAISYQNNIILWSIEEQKPLYKIQGTKLFSSVCFSKDGLLLATASYNDNNNIKIWDVETGTCIQTLNMHMSYAEAVCFSSDGNNLISSSLDKTINIYRKQPLNQLFTLSTLLFLEYALFSKENGITQLPSEELYFELFSQLPENFQRIIAELFDQEALKNYLDAQNK